MNAQDQLKAEIEKLRAENLALKTAQAPKNGLSLKVSEKGGLSVYGLGRFPVTLYAGQWTRLIENITRITAFIEANKAVLKEKGDA